MSDGRTGLVQSHNQLIAAVVECPIIKDLKSVVRLTCQLGFVEELRHPIRKSWKNLDLDPHGDALANARWNRVDPQCQGRMIVSFMRAAIVGL
jgi:hypothetical protein